jgi:hypothetical protein
VDEAQVTVRLPLAATQAEMRVGLNGLPLESTICRVLERLWIAKRSFADRAKKIRRPYEDQRAWSVLTWFWYLRLEIGLVHTSQTFYVARRCHLQVDTSASS